VAVKVKHQLYGGPLDGAWVELHADNQVGIIMPTRLAEPRPGPYGLIFYGQANYRFLTALDHTGKLVKQLRWAP
jgi:hypothetical protein